MSLAGRLCWSRGEGKGSASRVIPGCALAQARNHTPGVRVQDNQRHDQTELQGLWILRCPIAHHSSRFARPGMTGMERGR